MNTHLDRLLVGIAAIGVKVATLVATLVMSYGFLYPIYICAEIWRNESIHWPLYLYISIIATVASYCLGYYIRIAK